MLDKFRRYICCHSTINTTFTITVFNTIGNKSNRRKSPCFDKRTDFVTSGYSKAGFEPSIDYEMRFDRYATS